MCKKFIIVLALFLLFISSAVADTVIWDFENGDDHNFILQSTYPVWPALDDPNTAGDESITGVGGAQGLPDYGIAWTVGPPTQFDGQKPAADVDNARVDANGLLDYSLGTERIATESGTLNTFNLNQHGDYIHTQENDQIASSPIVTLDANAVLTVWSWGGGSGTHAPEYDPDPAMWYTDGSSGIAVISAEEDDLYAILATLHLQGHGTLTEDTLDLSEFAGRRVFLDVVDAFEGSWGWLAVDKIQITNAISKSAAFVVQMHDGVLDGGFDQAQLDHLKMLGYDVKVVDYADVQNEVFTSTEADRYDLLVISESPNSNACDNLIGTAVPIMHQEAYGWDNFSFMGVRTDIRWASGTEVEIVNDTHPIIVDANIPLGPMTFFDPQNSWTTELVSMMAPGAELLAKINVEGNDYAIIMAFEEGAELADGNSVPNRAVCFSLPGLFPSDGGPFGPEAMTDEAWSLYDAAIAWLNPEPAETPEMVAHWPLDEGAGTVAADVVGGNDGEIVGNVTWIVDGGVSFDGMAGNHIAVPHAEAIEFGDEDFTVSLWIRYPIGVDPLGRTEKFIVKGTNGAPGTGSRYEVFLDNSGDIRFTIDNGPDNIKSRVEQPAAPILTGEWAHVVGVRDAANDLMLLYVDGVLLGTATDSSGDISNGEPMLIGEAPYGGDSMSGDIKDVRIFNAALTEDQIGAIY